MSSRKGRTHAARVVREQIAREKRRKRTLWTTIAAVLVLVIAGGIGWAVYSSQKSDEFTAPPGANDAGKPSSSQNIWARVPSGNPRSGMTGEDCSQPPDGVAENMLPCLSMTSMWTVSPRFSDRCAMVGS